MTAALHVYLIDKPAVPLAKFPKQREGRMLCFRQLVGVSCSYPKYVVLSRRGGFSIGVLEWRNQWGYYCFNAQEHVPMNLEILQEVYAMLKELSSVGVRRPLVLAS